MAHDGWDERRGRPPAVGFHREGARTPSTRRAVAGALQIRLKADFTGEDYVARRAWRDASVPACP